MGITKLDGQAGKDANKMVKALRDAGLSPTESMADYFGLKTGAVDPKAKKPVNKKPTIGQKVKSYATSAAMGLSDAGAGIIQGAAYAGDKVNQGINNAFGTNLATDGYESYNKQYRDANANAENIRHDAGRSGGDFVRGGTELTATVPAFFVGGGAGQGIKQGANFAGRQAAIGTGVGAARYADNGNQRTGNAIGGAIGGAVGGVVGEKVVAPVIGKAVGAVARRTANKAGTTAAAAERMVDDLISREDMVVGDAVRRNIVAEATKNLSKGKEVDAAALARQELLKKHDLKGTKAQISRDPIAWKNEVELAKNNPQLNDVRIQNHDQVRSTWQSLADDTNARPVDNNARMESTFQTLKQGDEAAQTDIGAKYSAARESTGSDARLNHLRFIDQTSRELEENGVGSFLKGDIRGIFKGMFDDPDFVFTHAKSEEIIKVLNKKLRTTTDGNERYALGIVRDQLEKEVDNTILDMSGALPNGQNVNLAESQGAWNEARGAARERFQNIESNPALKAALDDVAPDKAFDKFVLKANERDLVRLVDDLKKTSEGKQNLADLQGATIEHFISQASKGNDGAFSPAGLNRAINSFGNNRMKALFDSQQIARINDVKQVTDILLQQPLGSAVNHSNTASVLMPVLQSIVGFVGKAPLVGNLAQGGINTAAKKVVDINNAGAAAKAMSGQAGVTKGSSLGLTEEQLKMLGLIPKIGGSAGAAAGASFGN